jgi:hypothetical protein
MDCCTKLRLKFSLGHDVPHDSQVKHESQKQRVERFRITDTELTYERQFAAFWQTVVLAHKTTPFGLFALHALNSVFLSLPLVG